MIKENGHGLKLKEVWSNGTSRMYQQAQQKLKAAGKIAKEKSKEVWEKTTDYVRENPGKSVAISAGFGLLLGFFLTRSRRRD